MKSFLLFVTGLLIYSSGFSQSEHVGIGTTSPAFKLDVANGSINTDSVYRIGTTTVLSVLGSQNLFVGKHAGIFNVGIENTFSGTFSGYSNLGGSSNSFYGTAAGYINTEGNANSFFGAGAGLFNATGSDNSFFGMQAGGSNETGSSNSFFGRTSGVLNTSGKSNSFFGMSAGYANSTASANSFFGDSTGFSNTTGHSNSFFGKAAGYSNSTGVRNSFFGFSAGYYSTGSNNSIFGFAAGNGTSNTSGSNNSFFGFAAGNYNTLGAENSFFGRSAGIINTEGNFNSFFGRSSGASNTTGNYNTGLGYRVVIGSGNLTNATAIGANAQVNCSDCMVLGSVSGENEAISNVNVGIGTNSPNVPLSFASTTGKKISLYDSGGNSHYGFSVEPSQLQMYTDGAAGKISFGYYTSGVFTEGMYLDNSNTKLTVNGNILNYGNIEAIANITAGATITAGVHVNAYANITAGATITAGTDIIAGGNVIAGGDICYSGSIGGCSDIRYKTNLSPLSNALDKILQLHGINYDWKREEFKEKDFSDKRQIGFSAQELEKFIPEIVQTDTAGYKSVDYGRLTPVLVEAIKEQQIQIDAFINHDKAQQQQIDQQQQQIDELKQLVLELAAKN